MPTVNVLQKVHMRAFCAHGNRGNSRPIQRIDEKYCKAMKHQTILGNGQPTYFLLHCV